MKRVHIHVGVSDLDQAIGFYSALFDEGDTACCYARSDKSWLRDPAGIAWETFRTMADVQQFGGGARESANACCAPAAEAAPTCCAGDA